MNIAEELNIEKLRKEVNPVYSTAQSCLKIISALGDEDSENLRRKLGFSEYGKDEKGSSNKLSAELRESLAKAMPAFNVVVEARFFGINNFIRETGAAQVFDLPCGYTARGLKLARNGVRYFGADLPAVIDAVGPAAAQLSGDNENLSYGGVDATNYTSMRKALESAKGELTITTEGLLVYFSQPDLETVFSNIRKLLLEFGGRWITPDNELHAASGPVLSAILEGMPPEAAVRIADIAAGNAANTKVNNNVYFDKDIEKAKKFVSDMGFDLELIPMSRFMPEELSSLKEAAEEARSKVREILGAVNYWVMTPKAGISEHFSRSEDKFKADVRVSGDTLNISLAGRLDTISSPELLALYRKAEAKGGITSVSVDMKELEYISSAGLRVMLIMRKALNDGRNFSIINMNDAVKDIFETTGTDTIFC